MENQFDTRLTVHLVPALLDNYVFIAHVVNHTDCIVVDPGDAAPVHAFFQKHPHLTLKEIWITHHHSDHTGGIRELVEAHDPKVIGPQPEAADIPWVTNRLDHDQDTFESCVGTVRSEGVPGHTLGHVFYYVPEHDTAFVGDTLFNAGCGRLFEGTPEQMVFSLRKISSLPGHTIVYAAHEYTLNNLEFAWQWFETHQMEVPREIQQAYQHYKALRREDKPTLPFALETQKQINVFILCFSQQGRTALGFSEQYDAVEAFKVIRTAKDLL